MANISNILSQVHSSIYVLQAENSITGRAYMEEVLTQVWLKSIKLFNKEVNAITSGFHASSCKSMKKCAMKMKERNKERKKQCAPYVKMLLMEGSTL